MVLVAIMLFGNDIYISTDAVRHHDSTTAGYHIMSKLELCIEPGSQQDFALETALVIIVTIEPALSYGTIKSY